MRVDPHTMIEQIVQQVHRHWTSHDTDQFIDLLHDKLTTPTQVTTLKEINTAILKAERCLEETES